MCTYSSTIWYLQNLFTQTYTYVPHIPRAALGHYLPETWQPLLFPHGHIFFFKKKDIHFFHDSKYVVGVMHSTYLLRTVVHM